MANKFVLLILWISCILVQNSINAKELTFFRVCFVGDEKKESLCWKMSAEIKSKNIANIACVRAANVFECMSFIADGVADVVNLNAEQIYVAGIYYSLELILFEHFPATRFFTTDSAVVVKSSQNYKQGLRNLKGKRLCLSGSDENNLQWQSLSNVMLPLGIMEVYNGRCDSPLPSLAAHFGASCIPGKWSVDGQSKKEMFTLCLLCNQVCTDQDYYAGDDGALRCLAEGNGDVAVTSSSAIKDAIDEGKIDGDDFERLCIQGARKPLNDTCAWLGRKTNALAVKNNVKKNIRTRWEKIFLKIFEKFAGGNAEAVPKWWTILFSRRDVVALEQNFYHNTFERYLGQVFMRTMETPFPRLHCGDPMPLRFCVVLKSRLTKCKKMAVALLSKRIKPGITCVQASSMDECVRWIVHGQADLTSVTPQKAVETNRDHDLIPVAAERYDAPTEDANSYMVAVVRKGTNMTLERLAGCQSCHSSATDFLSWYAPMVQLESLKQLKIKDCNFKHAATAFFWRSCVPGIGSSAADPMFKYDTEDNSISSTTTDLDRSVWDPRVAGAQSSLCALCPDECSNRAPIDLDGSAISGRPEHGHHGALECLRRRESTADIAFVSNQSLAYLFQERMSNRFELLCLDGSRKALDQASECHWLKVPPEVLVVSARKMPMQDRKRITSLFMKAQQYYGNSTSIARARQQKSQFDGFFSIFSSEYDSDTIFAPLTTHLKPVWPSNSTEEALRQALGKDFFNVYAKTLRCTSGANYVRYVNINIFGLTLMYCIICIILG